MQPILFITLIEDLIYHVEITRGADQIKDEVDLILALGDDFAGKKWKIKAMKLTEPLWEVRIIE